MKTVTLNISDRYKALSILDNFKGSMADLSHILDDVKVLVVTEEEWTQAGKVEHYFNEQGQEVPKGDPSVKSGNLTWDNEKGPQKACELNQSTVDYLKTFIKEKDDAKEITVADKDLIHLQQSLTA